MGQKYTFTTEQILAFYLKKLKNFYERANISCKDVVLSVPSYFSNVERQCILDAADIADFKCLRTINESTAIALNYGFFRKKDLDPKNARIVAFVDFGHSKTTVTIASFVQGKTKILCHHSDRNLGARDFDYLMMEVIGEEFHKKHGMDVVNNLRCKLRILEGVEKARKIISSTTDALLNVDALMEDTDMNRKISRDEFEKMCNPLLMRFAQVLQETLTMSGKFSALTI